MKKLFWAISIVVLVSCGSEISDRERVDLLMDSLDRVASDSSRFEYDRHRFFNDLGTNSLDILVNVVTSSDSVIACNWNDHDRNPANVGHYVIDAYGQFDQRLGKKFVLTKKQQNSLSKLLGDTSNYDSNPGDCFMPHIAFLYFNKGQIIGQTNVCFICAGQKSVPKTNPNAFSENGVKKFKNFCTTVGLEIVDRTGP